MTAFPRTECLATASGRASSFESLPVMLNGTCARQGANSPSRIPNSRTCPDPAIPSPRTAPGSRLAQGGHQRPPGRHSSLLLSNPYRASWKHQPEHLPTMCERRPEAKAIVNLHTTLTVAVSCQHGIDESNEPPRPTAYHVMRAGAVPLVPSFPPDDLNLARAVREMAPNHHAVLLANRGPVLAGKSLADAAHATEEPEVTAKRYLAPQDMSTRPPTQEQVAEIRRRLPTRTWCRANNRSMRHVRDQDRNDERLRGND